ncbi:hypothetical protein E2562_000947 [Oryza meyeriana var. granulata]|uniref:FBD domain-containing protein n=1 Tax=Oryza meyeriana var. granulata TaxID=110450 RepID=A0A6G1CYF9_9ORYZ|nr:hypothetical protein E2562_000947 [Oryza meyeriana var. granulata]
MPPAGSFAALTALTIIGARMQGGDFEALCSPRCPRLQRLKVRGVELVAADDVSIRSNSLERLVFLVNGVGRLEVVAPRLRYFRATPKTIDNVSDAAGPGMLDANIAAPMLEDVAWYGVFNLLRHRFAEAGRRLQKLTVVDLPTAPLMRRFYVVDELVLHFGISPCCKV